MIHGTRASDIYSCWSHPKYLLPQVGGVILHSCWLGVFVNIGAEIDGAGPW